MAGTFLTEFDPAKLQYGQSGGTLLNGQKAVGISGAQVGEGGVTGDTNAIGYSAFDPAHQAVGDKMADYDAAGKFTGAHAITPENGTAKDLAQGIAMIAAAYFGANAAFGGLGGAAESAAGGATYTSPAEMDTLLAEQTAGGGGVQGTMLTGEAIGPDATGGYVSPGEVDQQLAQQTMGGNGYVSPGEVDQQLATQTSGEGGVNGAPDVTDPNYRNGSDINSDIATETGTAPPGSVNEGVKTPWYPNMPTPPTGPFDWIKDLLTPGTGTGGVTPAITTALQTAGLVGTLLTPKPSGTTQAPKPAETPPQPLVGAGSFTNATAQGGASGSLQGVAGTLLTSKDTFGYGRTMLH